MRKGAVIALLFAFLLQAGGLLLVYMLQAELATLGMQEELKNANAKFENIKLTYGEYQKGKVNSDEIYVDGKLYDIKSISFHKDFVEVVAINDVKEEQAIEGIEDYFDENNKGNKDSQRLLVKLIVSEYTVSSSRLTFAVQHVTNFFASLPMVAYNSPFTIIFSPPPEATV